MKLDDIFLRLSLLFLTLFQGFVLAEDAPQMSPGVSTTKNEIAQVEGENVAPKEPVKTIMINFNNVNAVELIRFISRISGKNFIFDEEDLQFQVTIVSEEATTLDNIMAALLQELRIHNLSLMEEGNNVIIHKNSSVNTISAIVADNIPPEEGKHTEIVTRLFRLNTADPVKIAEILKPLTSKGAIIEVFKDTNHLIVTDIATNIAEIALLVKSLDAPNNGLVIGQFAVRIGYIDSLIQLAQHIMSPISPDQTLIFVPHRAANSIFIVSTPFMIERTMALLQYLDQSQGMTRIFNLKDLKFTGGEGGLTVPAGEGRWELDSNGNWVFRPNVQAGVPQGAQPPEGSWYVDDQGNWHFRAGRAPGGPGGPGGVGGPQGRWVLDPQGVWVFQLAPGKSISPEYLSRQLQGAAELPSGHIERIQFYIYKLQYRKGDQLSTALGRIGQTLQQSTTTNADLVATINSIQWIESSNSLVFTGTSESIEKVKELIIEIDTPLRQVWIEMLILDTTLDDSLNYGVDWGSRFGGGNTSGSQAFLANGSNLPGGLDTTGVSLIPDASSLARLAGFSQGVIGQHLTHCGLRFNSIGALVRAVHSRTDTKIVLTPRVLTEDNSPAEIFVGINTQFPTQAVVNDRGSIVTQNFEFRDVGTRLKVLPQIGDNNIITLTVEEEVSSVISVSQLGTSSGPTTRKNTAKTKFHIPNEYFLVMSGLMEDDNSLTRDQVPCLGGIPFIGAGFSHRNHTDSRRNLLIFIRPRIIDTSEEVDNLTKHQQDAYNYHDLYLPMWEQETKEALDFFNLPDCDEECKDCCPFR